MALIYITGISGSGKTTISKELQLRGYEAHNADGEGFNTWFENRTGKIAKGYDEDIVGTEEWDKNYTWKTIRKKVEELSQKAKDKTVYLCGVSGNENEVWDLFSKVIILVIDEKTLRHRIATRTTSIFGKQPHQLEAILGWHKTYPGDYPKRGAVVVDATKSLENVVDNIIEITNRSDLVIRSYQTSDKDIIKNLYILASVNSEIGYRDGPWYKDLDDVEKFYLNGGDFLVGLIKGEIVAIVGLEKISETEGHIRRMRVHPEYRRKGYAQQILIALEKRAKNLGFKQLRLRTSTQQTMAQGLYEKSEYKKMETKKEYYAEGGGNTFEVIWYKKELV
jgi:ribosomal protein S18 acetylase RimI-like enzyme